MIVSGVLHYIFKALLLNIFHMVKNAFREDLRTLKRQTGVQCVTYWNRGHWTAAKSSSLTYLENLKKNYII